MTISDHRTGAVPLVSGFDHGTDPQILADPFARWQELQEEARAFRSDAPDEWDVWYLTRYDDIYAAHRDTELFSSRSNQYRHDWPVRMLPIELDPPAHAPFRQVLNGPLSPGNVAALEGEVRALARGLIAGFAADGSCEFLDDFARRFPTQVFLQLMGLPTEHTEHFVDLTRAAVHITHDDDPDFAQRGAALFEIVAVVSEALADRREHPRPDLLTHLATSAVDGRPLTDEEAVAMATLVYLAGLDTVVGLLSYAVRHLAGDPELRHRLTAEPQRWPRAIEEFLRYYSIAAVGRVVTRDAEFAGCPMKEGDRLVLVTAAAGRDARAFERAGEFDPDRPDNRHLAFGAGAHRCAGAHLARLELRVFMEEWHAAIPDYDVAPGATITQHAGLVAGLDGLPLVWPGAAPAVRLA